MEWYQYIAAFFAGAFLANAVPHFVQGISGNKFPTPFAKPPGKGLSSAPLNVAWGLLNIVIGLLLCKAGKVQHHHHRALAIFFVGFAAMSIMMAYNFQKKDKE
jgi:uncharacterized membrane protein